MKKYIYFILCGYVFFSTIPTYTKSDDTNGLLGAALFVGSIAATTTVQYAQAYLEQEELKKNVTLAKQTPEQRKAIEQALSLNKQQLNDIQSNNKKRSLENENISFNTRKSYSKRKSFYGKPNVKKTNKDLAKREQNYLALQQNDLESKKETLEEQLKSDSKLNLDIIDYNPQEEYEVVHNPSYGFEETKNSLPSLNYKDQSLIIAEKFVLPEELQDAEPEEQMKYFDTARSILGPINDNVTQWQYKYEWIIGKTRTQEKPTWSLSERNQLYQAKMIYTAIKNNNYNIFVIHLYQSLDNETKQALDSALEQGLKKAIQVKAK